MQELGFEDRNPLSSGFGARDVSPDSVIFTGDSYFSLFSSASGSVDRCSFASDLHDHDSLASEVSQHLAGHDMREASSGPDSDPRKPTVLRNSRLSRKVENTEVQNEETEAETDDKNQNLDSARNLFSQALKECQDRRSRSEVLKKPERRRPASLDLNNHITHATFSSPRFGVTKKGSVMTRLTGTFPSPGTPNYRHSSVGIQKGWSSERVPSHSSASKRNVTTALFPVNTGRTLPSKWEDAERWIFSPLSNDGTVKTFQQPQRRPKSKSGPLGPPGIAYHSPCSPAIPMFEGGNLGNLMAPSPFSAGVIAPDRLSILSNRHVGGGASFPTQKEPCMNRSVTVHGFSEMLNQSSMPDPEGAKLENDKGAATSVSRIISRRDMATQMSPEHSTHSSPRRESFSPVTPSVLPIVELENVSCSKSEVRDVQVDLRVTMTRWSKKQKARFPYKGSKNMDNSKKKAAETRSCTWDVSEAVKTISKMKREEAKITAWENLQKAKAEAAIRKLEMKLEKKRSSSMDKIMNKLRSAQKKAQEMRSSVLANEAHQVVRRQHKGISFCRTRQISSLSGCFTCHAF